MRLCQQASGAPAGTLTRPDKNHINIETPRKLTIDEKRKLERLLFDDIEQAERTYSSTRSTQREKLTEAAEKNPPTQAVKLFKDWQEGQKAAEKAQKACEVAQEALNAIGYRASTGYGSPKDGSLEVSSRLELPKALKDFDTETRQWREKLAALKREYTLKLFAGAQAHDLFQALASDLATLAK